MGSSRNTLSPHGAPPFSFASIICWSWNPKQRHVLFTLPWLLLPSRVFIVELRPLYFSQALSSNMGRGMVVLAGRRVATTLGGNKVATMLGSTTVTATGSWQGPHHPG